jgi:thymidylate synthase
MALPPCHMFCQFYVSTPEPNAKAKLSCLLYQRSCDVGLGVPFNIASYALLCRMIAHACDLDAGEFIHTMGGMLLQQCIDQNVIIFLDAHVYLNHVDALKIQIEREPRDFPRLTIKTPSGGGLEALEKMTMDDFELTGYMPHGKIAMDMSV